MKEQDGAVKWFNTVFFPAHRTARAVRYEDGVLPRFRENAITFFTPWGPRYSFATRGVTIVEGDKETQVLYHLADLFQEICQNMPSKQFRWIFLGADLYGTRINHLPEEVTAAYYASLEEWLRQILPNAEFCLWSTFDAQAEAYRRKVRENFGNLVPANVVAQATQTARTMGKGSDPREYLVERVAEAMLVEETFRPIKVSCVGRHKDDGVDAELPRLYLLPQTLWAPWM